MRYVERSELMEHFEAFARANADSFVIASSTEEPEQVFLDALRQLSAIGEGVVARLGFRVLVATTELNPTEIERLLRGACPGSWYHVAAAVTPNRNVLTALQEVDCRASKSADHTNGTRFEILP